MSTPAKESRDYENAWIELSLDAPSIAPPSIVDVSQRFTIVDKFYDLVANGWLIILAISLLASFWTFNTAALTNRVPAKQLLGATGVSAFICLIISGFLVKYLLTSSEPFLTVKGFLKTVFWLGVISSLVVLIQAMATIYTSSLVLGFYESKKVDISALSIEASSFASVILGNIKILITVFLLSFLMWFASVSIISSGAPWYISCARSRFFRGFFKVLALGAVLAFLALPYCFRYLGLATTNVPQTSLDQVKKEWTAIEGRTYSENIEYSKKIEELAALLEGEQADRARYSKAVEDTVGELSKISPNSYGELVLPISRVSSSLKYNFSAVDNLNVGAKTTLLLYLLDNQVKAHDSALAVRYWNSYNYGFLKLVQETVLAPDLSVSNARAIKERLDKLGLSDRELLRGFFVYLLFSGAKPTEKMQTSLLVDPKREYAELNLRRVLDLTSSSGSDDLALARDLWNTDELTPEYKKLQTVRCIYIDPARNIFKSEYAFVTDKAWDLSSTSVGLERFNNLADLVVYRLEHGSYPASLDSRYFEFKDGYLLPRPGAMSRTSVFTVYSEKNGARVETKVDYTFGKVKLP